MSEDMKKAPHVLSVADLYDLTTYDFTVANGPGGRPCVLKLRRMDMLTILMEDIVNAPLMDAAMKVIGEVREWLKENTNDTFESAFEHLTPEKKQTVLDHLRLYATKVVLQPKLTLETPAPADAFPVQLFRADTLFAIWNHTPDAAVIQRLSEVAAEQFRPSAIVDPAGAASDGAGLQSAAGVVGAAGREAQ